MEMAWMESLEVLASWVWERKGGLLSLEEEKSTELVGSSNKFAPRKDMPLGVTTNTQVCPRPIYERFIHSSAQQLTKCDQLGIGSLNLEPLLNH